MFLRNLRVGALALQLGAFLWFAPAHELTHHAAAPLGAPAWHGGVSESSLGPVLSGDVQDASGCSLCALADQLRHSQAGNAAVLALALGAHRILHLDPPRVRVDGIADLPQIRAPPFAA
jgi:hypothetical protein